MSVTTTPPGSKSAILKHSEGSIPSEYLGKLKDASD